ncbi:serpin B4-like [Paramacrobiotus metropolitanus]|uniref:serpin B4-like n=1 Tax=Paramacrobiotus metropolitanus TaxID=2943436 RepID=UPI00244657B9|nr:serpin B4-like [Paramacrobiotus metropolitanus]
MSTPVTPDTDAMAAAVIAPFSLANNQFSLDLYGNLIASKPRNENGFLSPFSVMAALSMVNVGAKGKTKQQILKATHLDKMNDTFIDSAFMSLFTRLEVHTAPSTAPATPPDEWARQTPYLAIANRVYLQKGFSFKQEFGDVLKNFYQTTFGEADFAGNAQQATRDVNQWVESVTNHRIQNLFSQIEPSVKLALVSAIYFKAEWEDHFQKEITQNGDFFGEGNTFKNVPFMKQTDDEAKFAKLADVDATGLIKPYAHGAVHMLFILPNKKDGLAALEKKLRPAHFDISKYQRAEVEITLPRFKIESDFNLNAALKQIGIVDAFQDNADFSGISTQPLKISEVVHKTFVEVNEKGTEAAAATGMKMVPLSAVFFPEDMKKVFKADHPFLFAIQHRETGAILFIGRVSNPSPA